MNWQPQSVMNSRHCRTLAGHVTIYYARSTRKAAIAQSADRRQIATTTVWLTPCAFFKQIVVVERSGYTTRPIELVVGGTYTWWAAPWYKTAQDDSKIPKGDCGAAGASTKGARGNRNVLPQTDHQMIGAPSTSTVCGNPRAQASVGCTTSSATQRAQPHIYRFSLAHPPFCFLVGHPYMHSRVVPSNVEFPCPAGPQKGRPRTTAGSCSSSSS